MKIEKFSKITLDVTVDGKRYSVRFVPESATPIDTKRTKTLPFDDAPIRKAIAELGFDETCVDATAINKHLGGGIPGKSVAHALEKLGYDESVRFKAKDGLIHYVRYNSILITAREAVQKIKGL